MSPKIVPSECNHKNYENHPIHFCSLISYIHFHKIFVEDGQRIKYFYEQFLAAGKIEIKDDIFSEHGFVSFNNF